MLRVRIIIIKKKKTNENNLSDKQKTIKCVKDARSGSSRCANPWTVAEANPRSFSAETRHSRPNLGGFIHFTPAC